MNARALTSDNHYFDNPYGVRSLSLEEIITQAPPRSLFTRMGNFIKLMVMTWGLISLGAVVGVSTYYFNDTPQASLLVSERAIQPAAPAAATPSVPEADRLAAAFDAAPSAESVFAPATLPDIAVLQPAAVQISSLQLSPSDVPSPQFQPSTADIRMPRPRPNEPVITGSIKPPRYDPAYAPPHRRRIAGPCATLKKLGAPVRC